MRQELRHWLRRLHDEIHVTSVFVTHDQEEALEVADRVVVMNQARIEQVGTPEEVYEHPATPFVFNFLGHVNLFRCRGVEDETTPGTVTCPVGDAEGKIGYVRPGDIRISRNAESSEDLPAEIVFIQGAGPLPRVELKRLDTGETVQAELPRERYRELGLKIGEQVFIRPTNMRVFVPDYQI